MLGTLNVPVTDNLALRANVFAEKRDGFADQGDGRSDLAGQGFSGPDGIPDFDQRWNRDVDESETYGNAGSLGGTHLGHVVADRPSVLARLCRDRAGQDAGMPIAPNCEANPDLCV